MKTTQTLLAAAVLLTLAGTANATLVGSLDSKTVYDTDLDITWLADANYAKTSSYDADGMMTWSQAQGWIASLNASNYLGYHDWRLPTTLQPDASCGYQSFIASYGYNCSGSEMGHLFYKELGGVAGQSITTTHNANYSLFQNVQSNFYWSGTEYAPSTNLAWYFNTYYGNQGGNGKNGNMFALAVRPGQVAAVPVPAAAWLLGSGLLGLIGVARRKAA